MFNRIKNKVLNRKIEQDTPENWHEKFITEMAKLLQPDTYVELGVYQADLFNKLIPYCKKLIAVDIDPQSTRFIHSSSKTIFINSTTDEFAQQLRYKPIEIDMLFIDSDHRKEQLEKDFENFFPYVVDQGIVLIHDTYPKNKKYTNSGYCADGYKYVEEISRERTDFELVTIPLHPGLTFSKKRNNLLGWKDK